MHLVFDIGGTRMRLASSEKLDNPVVLDTPQNYHEALLVIERVGKELISQSNTEAKFEAVAGGIAGPFDQEKQKLANAPHLLDWIGKPIAQDLKNIFQTEVYLENDAAMIGLGEAVMGAGKGSRIVAFLSIGTGVGGARIVDGRIDQSAMGFEPGHQVININDMGAAETLENLVSGSGLQARYGTRASEITDPKIWKDVAEKLAIGVHNVIMMWSPDVVVIGGGLGTSGKIPLQQPFATNFRVYHSIFEKPPEVRFAQLGDGGGLQGAMQLLRQNNLN